MEINGLREKELLRIKALMNTDGDGIVGYRGFDRYEHFDSIFFMPISLPSLKTRIAMLAASLNVGRPKIESC